MRAREQPRAEGATPSPSTIRRMVISAIVASVCVTSAIGFNAYERDHGEEAYWASLSDEQKVYDHIYDPSRLGYDRATWGGRVIHPGEPGASVSLDPKNLVLPVYAFDEVDLATEGDARAVASRLFPELDIRHAKIALDHEATGSVRFSTPNWTMTLNNRGDISFRSSSEYLTSGVPLIQSDDEAEAFAFKYLAEHGGIPDGIGMVQAYRWNESFRDEAVRYAVYMSRASDGIENVLWHDPLGISVGIDGRTKEVISYNRIWPVLRTAFYVTDLPSPSWIVEAKGLNASMYRAPYWSPGERSLSYMIPDNPRLTPLHTTVGTFYVMPHWVAIEASWIETTAHFLNAIFPDEVVFVSS